MALYPAGPVASGRLYHVKACRGRVPTALADFRGETDFTLSTETGTTVVRGVGAVHRDSVRFSEKDVALGGKDVRVWHITQEADGGFTAATGPSVLLGWPFGRRPVLPG
ncbi:hypothetical protein [Jatrophihabitans sp.]|jgi:hypothetical protein|uniref:hypothetical protein n=1 Tax=Jatrophihabitans sp. TaxID=1932789 RepID=UPI002F0EFA86